MGHGSVATNIIWLRDIMIDRNRVGTILRNDHFKKHMLLGKYLVHFYVRHDEIIYYLRSGCLP